MRLLAIVLLLASLIDPCLADAPPQLSYQIQSSYPHNPEFFTQGLLFYQGQLYESTGQYGQSQLVRYDQDFQTPVVLRSLEPRYFGEGIAVLNDQLFLLTWKAGTAMIYSPSDFTPTGSFDYQGEGWGLTSDGQSLWMSNGSDVLAQRDAKGKVLQQVKVTINGKPLDRINELEYVNGLIVANRWYDSHIYVIDPGNGDVIGVMDFTDLAAPQLKRGDGDVLNGIAWNPQRKTLWITGKDWDRLYELKVNLPHPGEHN